MPVPILVAVLISAQVPVSALTQPRIRVETERDLMVWRESEAKEKENFGDKRKNFHQKSHSRPCKPCKATWWRNLRFQDHLRMRRRSDSITACQGFLYKDATRIKFNSSFRLINIFGKPISRPKETQPLRCEASDMQEISCPDLMTPLGVLHHYQTGTRVLRPIGILKLLFGQNDLERRTIRSGFKRIPAFQCEEKASVTLIKVCINVH